MVFPIGDDDSRLHGRHHIVTLLLIAANIGVFLLQLAQGANLERFIYMWSVVPFEYSTGTDLDPQIPVPFWSTLLTSMFMHGGIAHIAGNMLYLWIFGDNVEDAMGRGRFLIFYLVCGAAAALAQVLVDPDSRVPSLGASGAISGVLGAYVLLYPNQRVRVFLLRGITEMPAMFVLGLWILLQFVNGWGQITRTQTEETGGVAYAAHIGGFVAGMILVWFFRRRDRLA